MVSPPPAIENASLSAIALAISSVPLAKLSNSNTPTGPFQRMVLAFLMISTILAVLLGPKSKILSSAVTSATSLISAAAVSLNSLPVTTSITSGIVVLLAISLAVSTRSGSYKEPPTFLPSAAMKVLAIPPPTMIWSAILAKEYKTSSLVETLEPPTIATIGLAGLSIALPKASSSAARRGPAHAIGAN